ncbi:hypothetical protein BaRGS_00015942 [Batillaria attramentaria]|uniref:Uncharacterized protein n=1 Tax=Batillaria attramentaria TaxID=370345 RepID=A0ABD0L145_9CAEN
MNTGVSTGGGGGGAPRGARWRVPSDECVQVTVGADGKKKFVELTRTRDDSVHQRQTSGCLARYGQGTIATAVCLAILLARQSVTGQ